MTFKTFPVLFSSLCLTVFSMSCSQDITTDGRVATALPQTDTALIEQVTEGGFTPTPRRTTLILYRSGEMVKTMWEGTTNPGDPGTTITIGLGKLSSPVLDFLVLNANSLTSGTLQFDPSAPVCADAPTTTYTANSVKNGVPEAIVFMKKEDCIEKKLTSGEAMNLTSMAKALEILSNSTL